MFIPAITYIWTNHSTLRVCDLSRDGDVGVNTTTTAVAFVYIYTTKVIFNYLLFPPRCYPNICVCVLWFFVIFFLSSGRDKHCYEFLLLFTYYHTFCYCFECVLLLLVKCLRIPNCLFVSHCQLSVATLCLRYICFIDFSNLHFCFHTRATCCNKV